MLLHRGWGRAAPLWGAAAPRLPLQQTLTLSTLSQGISRATGFAPRVRGADSARRAFGKKGGGRGGRETQKERGRSIGAGRALGASSARAGGRRAPGCRQLGPSQAVGGLQEDGVDVMVRKLGSPGRAVRPEISRAEHVQGGSIHAAQRVARGFGSESGRKSSVKGIPGKGLDLFWCTETPCRHLHGQRSLPNVATATWRHPWPRDLPLLARPGTRPLPSPCSTHLVAGGAVAGPSMGRGLETGRGNGKVRAKPRRDPVRRPSRASPKAAATPLRGHR